MRGPEWPKGFEQRLIELWTAGASAIDIARTFTETGFPCDVHQINARVSKLRDKGVSLPPHRKMTAAGKVIGGVKIATLAPLPLKPGEVVWPESPRGCVWPLWSHDGPRGEEPRRFCGSPAAPGRPYCSSHTAKSISTRADGDPLDA